MKKISLDVGGKMSNLRYYYEGTSPLCVFSFVTKLDWIRRELGYWGWWG